MSVTATPTFTVADVAVVASPAGSQLLAVRELRLTWGRSTVLEEAKVSTVTMTIRDRSRGGQALARRTDLIGRLVTMGYALSGGGSYTNFRGRITAVNVTPYRDAVGGGGYRVEIAASSTLLDLANITMPEGTVWPAETFAARRNRLTALLPAGFSVILTPGLTSLGLAPAFLPGQELDELTAAQVDVGGDSLLDLLRMLYRSTSPLPMVHNLDDGSINFARRRRFTYSADRGLTMAARLVAHADKGGRYVAAGLSQNFADAGAMPYSDGVGQALDSRLTRVEVKYLDSSATPAYSTRTASAATTDTPAEATIGRRTLSVETWQTNAANAAGLAGLFADVVNRETRTPRLQPITFTTAREPFHSAGMAQLLLAGHETDGVLFVNGSWLPPLGLRPLVGVLGATVTYRMGQWTVEFVPAPTIVDPGDTRAGGLTVRAFASSPAVRIRDLDRSLTFGDLAHVQIGAGYTPLTANPYVGNPT